MDANVRLYARAVGDSHETENDYANSSCCYAAASCGETPWTTCKGRFVDGNPTAAIPVVDRSRTVHPEWLRQSTPVEIGTLHCRFQAHAVLAPALQ